MLEAEQRFRTAARDRSPVKGSGNDCHRLRQPGAATRSKKVGRTTMRMDRTALGLATALTCATPMTGWAQAAPKLVDKLNSGTWTTTRKAGARFPPLSRRRRWTRQVASGALPPVEKRLPQREDVLVVSARDMIGGYGGDDLVQRHQPELLRQYRMVGLGRAPDRLHDKLGRDRPDLARSVELPPTIRCDGRLRRV